MMDSAQLLPNESHEQAAQEHPPDSPLLSIDDDSGWYKKGKERRIWGTWSTCFLIMSWLLSITLLVVLFFEQRNMAELQSSCFWKPHELEGVRREISPKWKEVTFRGGLKLKNGGFYRDIDPTKPPYVGTPTPEMDTAWDKLTRPLNILVTLDEAAVTGTEGMLVEPESGLYMAMPQGIHDLHCLNMLRKALYLEYYPEINGSDFHMHIDHCIDSLRQSLMCTGDMTMIKESWSEENNRMVAEFNNVHMCRDFDSIREWVDSRNGEDDAVWPAVAHRLWSRSRK